MIADRNSIIINQLLFYVFVYWFYLLGNFNILSLFIFICFFIIILLIIFIDSLTFLFLSFFNWKEERDIILFISSYMFTCIYLFIFLSMPVRDSEKYIVSEKIKCIQCTSFRTTHTFIRIILNVYPIKMFFFPNFQYDNDNGPKSDAFYSQLSASEIWWRADRRQLSNRMPDTFPFMYCTCNKQYHHNLFWFNYISDSHTIGGP